jgi:sarcinarray family protein
MKEIAIVISSFLAFQAILVFPAEAGELQVDAYFNGKPATVDWVEMMEGENFNIRISIKVSSPEVVDVLLYSPGFPPDEPQPFRVVKGPSGFNQFMVISMEDSKELTWVLEPTGVWVNGVAPINLVVISEKEEKYREHFTIAKVYIKKGSDFTKYPVVLLSAVGIAGLITLLLWKKDVR